MCKTKNIIYKQNSIYLKPYIAKGLQTNKTQQFLTWISLHYKEYAYAFGIQYWIF